MATSTIHQLKNVAEKKSKIFQKYPVYQVSTIRFITKCRTRTSIVPMCPPCRECMQMLRLAVRLTTFVTTDARDIKAHNFSALTVQFSIKKSSLAIGGTMLNARRRPITISKCCLNDFTFVYNLYIKWGIKYFSFFHW